MSVSVEYETKQLLIREHKGRTNRDVVLGTSPGQFRQIHQSGDSDRRNSLRREKGKEKEEERGRIRRERRMGYCL
jgi:hypothetical protein